MATVYLATMAELESNDEVTWNYSGICLKQTPSVQKNLSALDKCPLYSEFS